MTDNEIIRALECCMHKNTEMCKKCPCYKDNTCKTDLDVYILDLIKRQTAEIEKLNFENLKMVASVKRLKAEVLKEFLCEIIGNILPKYLYGHEETALRIGFALSEKAKEMTEG